MHILSPTRHHTSVIFVETSTNGMVNVPRRVQTNPKHKHPPNTRTYNHTASLNMFSLSFHCGCYCVDAGVLSVVEDVVLGVDDEASFSFLRSMPLSEKKTLAPVRENRNREYS